MANDGEIYAPVLDNISRFISTELIPQWGMDMDRFKGGQHTVAKVAALAEYLKAYATALQGQGFALAYIDAFAGSGSFSLAGRSEASIQPGMLGEDGTISMPGSARIALDTEPQFHTLVFIEKDAAAAQQLRLLKDQHPSRKMVVVEDEANGVIRRICSNLPWRGNAALPSGIRAVMFLDPFALSVDWDTLLAIARTKGVDLWYLLPVGAINRLLAGDIGKVHPNAAELLSRILGGDWWRDEFYLQHPPLTNLFGEDEEQAPTKTGSRIRIEEAFIARMEPHFGYVHPRGLRLKKNGQHYFSLVFAVANPARAAVDLAKKFAQSIIDKPQGVIPLQRSRRQAVKHPGIA